MPVAYYGWITSARIRDVLDKYGQRVMERATARERLDPYVRSDVQGWAAELAKTDQRYSDLLRSVYEDTI